MTENSEQTSFCIRDGARQIKVIGPVWPVQQPDGSYMLYTSKPDGYDAHHTNAAIAESLRPYWLEGTPPHKSEPAAAPAVVGKGDYSTDLTGWDLRPTQPPKTA